ncbi:MAG: M20/M25/M40 family metallo-hydrolase [Pseudomonadota bacterium]|nr:M20/M25/M40 family metallo-hydrolase [Pseudomonadota bacterium]
MKRSLATLLFLTAFPGIAAAQSVIQHALTIKLDPQHHHIHARDLVTFAAGSPRRKIFSLHPGLEPRSLTQGVVIEPLDVDKQSLAQQFRLQLDDGLDAFIIEYEGVIHHPLEAYGREQARGFRDTPGLIGSEGVYLAGGTFWYPQFDVDERLNFKLEVTLPAAWSSVSQGQRVRHHRGEHNAIDTWVSNTPQEEIYLIAAPFVEYSRDSGEVIAQVFLRQQDEKLANDYLDATGRYLGMYQQLLGPYPYSKFALVENFWETGFGMPSFTLLGSKVIRLPFILNSSYPHEILHNWWGNGVYVDFSTGNWSEGLTAYLADHLIKQQQGGGVGYRQQSLQKYTDYAAAGRDFPLKSFRGRHSSASEAVGYGKTMMLFHMLRQQLGDRLFTEGLQQFYRKWQFQKASFDDLRASFEGVFTKPLGTIFEQWVDRSGAPALKLTNSEVSQRGDLYHLTFQLSQTQPGKAYQLLIPVAVTLNGEKQAHQSIVAMKHRRQQFEIELSSLPQRIDIDPEFDLFRKLALEETPPAFTQLFGSNSMLVVLPSTATPVMKKAWRRFAEDLARMGPESVTLAWDDELETLPEQRSIVVLGWENRHAEEMTTALSANGVQFKADSLTIGKTSLPRSGHALALVTRHQQGGQHSRAFIAADLPESLPGLGRKLPHYHKYSYLAFSGTEPENQLKGRWQVERSPLTAMFAENAERGQLARREALIDSPSVFDSKRMLETVRFLAGDALQGRGFGEPGLDQAAEYIAGAFREAGLQPAGDDPGSFFQSWQESGGDPVRAARLKNVIAVIPAADPKRRNESIVIGAHYDHLGRGWPDVRDGNQGQIHHGADDNASGVAVLLELARVLGKDFKPDRNIVLAAFSGEEAGRRGSKHYIERLKANPADNIFAMINLDTVGRLGDNKLLVLGASSASEWPHIFRGIGYVSGIPIAMVAEELDSSDQVSFHETGIPAVQLFSGVNPDYHRPTDTAEKIDAEGLVKVATVTKEALEYLAGRDERMTATLPAGRSSMPKSGKQRKVTLGTVPDFSYQGEGYRLHGVTPGSPAMAAGLTQGDVIIQLNDTAVHGLRDLSNILKTLQPGEIVTIHYRRQGSIVITQVILRAKNAQSTRKQESAGEELKSRLPSP